MMTYILILPIVQVFFSCKAEVSTKQGTCQWVSGPKNI